MIKFLRKKFTEWYYKKGYTINSIPGSPTFDYVCPKWVKFFAKFLFYYDYYIWQRIWNLEEKCDG